MSQATPAPILGSISPFAQSHPQIQEALVEISDKIEERGLIGRVLPDATEFFFRWIKDGYHQAEEEGENEEEVATYSLHIIIDDDSDDESEEADEDQAEFLCDFIREKLGEKLSEEDFSHFNTVVSDIQVWVNAEYIY